MNILLIENNRVSFQRKYETKENTSYKNIVTDMNTNSRSLIDLGSIKIQPRSNERYLKLQHNGRNTLEMPESTISILKENKTLLRKENYSVSTLESNKPSSIMKIQL